MQLSHREQWRVSPTGLVREAQLRVVHRKSGHKFIAVGGWHRVRKPNAWYDAEANRLRKEVLRQARKVGA